MTSAQPGLSSALLPSDGRDDFSPMPSIPLGLQLSVQESSQQVPPLPTFCNSSFVFNISPNLIPWSNIAILYGQSVKGIGENGGTSHTPLWLCSGSQSGQVICASCLQFTGYTLFPITSVLPGRLLRGEVTAARVGRFCLGALLRSYSPSTAWTLWCSRPLSHGLAFWWERSTSYLLGQVFNKSKKTMLYNLLQPSGWDLHWDTAFHLFSSVDRSQRD